MNSLKNLATQTQRLAADPTLNVWVSASAGTGKTKILTDRVLNLLLNGANPSRLLCITFTKAAAAEMFKRLSDRLSRWATLDKEPLAGDILQTLGYSPTSDQLDLAKSLLLRVLETPGGLKIQTIHSFCQSVLSRFPLEAGISPGIQVLDELSSKNLKQKALNKTLEESLHTDEPLLSRAIRILSESMDYRTVCEILESHPPVKMMPQTHFQEFTLKPHIDIPDPSRLINCAQILLTGKKTDQDRGESILAFFNKDLSTRENFFPTYVDAYLTKDHEIRARLATTDLIRNHPYLEETLRFEAERLQEILHHQKEIKSQNMSLAFNLLALKCQDTYEALKQKKGALDFDDLIRHTARLFSLSQMTPWVLYKLDGGIDHILVDEAQDTNAEQWQIITALVEEFFHNDVIARKGNALTRQSYADKDEIASLSARNDETIYNKDVIARKGNALTRQSYTSRDEIASPSARNDETIYNKDVIARKGIALTRQSYTSRDEIASPSARNDETIYNKDVIARKGIALTRQSYTSSDEIASLSARNDETIYNKDVIARKGIALTRQSYADKDEIASLSARNDDRLNNGSYRRTVFIVGDTKQSIYSFQGANPLKFQEIEAHFAQLAAQTHNPWKRIDLEVTFRSAPAILALVDESLKNPVVKQATQFANTSPPHRAFRHTAGGRVELWPLIPAEEKSAPPAWEAAQESAEKRIDPKTTCARLISAQIADWLRTGKRLPSKGRPIQPKDILILVQRRGDFVDSLVKELKRHNVQVSGSDRMRLMDQLVVKDLIALADFLLFPEDDLTLAIVLKSSFLDITEEDLLSLCPHRTGSLWTELKKHADENPRFAKACNLLRALLRNLDYLRPYELYSQILIKHGGKERIFSRLGIECQDALEEFLNLTLQFERSQVPSLQNFVHWIRSGQSEVKRDMDESTQNRVRIMTVHGAKGLQAPIVILPDTTRIPTLQESILPHENGHHHWLPPSHMDTTTTKSLKVIHESKQIAEYYRLYYVALTRAEDHLIICGWENARTKSQLTWHEVTQQSLSNLGAVMTPETNHLVFEHPYQGEENAITANDLPPSSPLPEYLRKETPVFSPQASPLLPSKLGESEAYGHSVKPSFRILSPDERGTLIHRLLEILPQIPQSQWVERGEKHIDKVLTVHGRRDSFDSAVFLQERESILTEAIQSLKKIISLSNGCRALYRELPLEGFISERPVSAVIDLLIDYPDRALVVDYKTNFSPPQTIIEIPAAYRRQIFLYQQLAEKILSKPVSCGILWTSTLTWMEMPVEEKSDLTIAV